MTGIRIRRRVEGNTRHEARAKKKEEKKHHEEPNQIGSELPVFPRARRRRLNELQLHNGAAAPRCH